MANHFAFPEGSHFGSEFALGVEPGILGDPYPRHPRGQARAGRYVDRGRDGGSVISRTFCYTVPDGSDAAVPIPAVGERMAASGQVSRDRLSPFAERIGKQQLETQVGLTNRNA